MSDVSYWLQSYQNADRRVPVGGVKPHYCFGSFETQQLTLNSIICMLVEKHRLHAQSTYRINSIYHIMMEYLI